MKSCPRCGRPASRKSALCFQCGERERKAALGREALKLARARQAELRKPAPCQVVDCPHPATVQRRFCRAHAPAFEGERSLASYATARRGIEW